MNEAVEFVRTQIAAAAEEPAVSAVCAVADYLDSVGMIIAAEAMLQGLGGDTGSNDTRIKAEMVALIADTLRLDLPPHPEMIAERARETSRIEPRG